MSNNILHKYMHQGYLSVLKGIGLSDAEARTYLANILLGPSSVIKIAQKAGLTRQMVYTILPKLHEMGLIKESKTGSKTAYEPTDIENLSSIVGNLSIKIKELVPELKSRQATSSAIPLVTVYENPIAMRDWYKQFIKEAKKEDELLVWSGGRNWYNLDLRFYQKWIKFKDSLKMKNLVITPDITENKKEIWGQAIFKNSKFKYLKKWWRTNAEKWIWKDQVCYLTMRENATNMIVIESKDLVEIERFDFYRIWNSLK